MSVCLLKLKKMEKYSVEKGHDGYREGEAQKAVITTCLCRAKDRIILSLKFVTNAKRFPCLCVRLFA